MLVAVLVPAFVVITVVRQATGLDGGPKIDDRLAGKLRYDGKGDPLVRTPISDEDALRFIEIVSVAPVVPIDTEVVLEAVSFKQRFGLSYWDAAIVAAAHVLGAKTLFTEDLNAGQRYGDVLAVDPFR